MASARKFDQSKVGRSICFDNEIPPWQHDLSSKDILSGVNFTNIFWAAFAPKSFCQKITNPNCMHIKAAQKMFVWKKVLVKYWWNWHLMSNIFELTCLLIKELFIIYNYHNASKIQIQPSTLTLKLIPHRLTTRPL